MKIDLIEKVPRVQVRETRGWNKEGSTQILVPYLPDFLQKGSQRLKGVWQRDSDEVNMEVNMETFIFTDTYHVINYVFKIWYSCRDR